MKITTKTVTFAAITALSLTVLALHAARARNEAPRLRSIREIRAAFGPARAQKDLTRTTAAAPLFRAAPKADDWKGPGRFELNGPFIEIELDDRDWFEPGTARMNSRGIAQVSAVAEAIKKLSLSWQDSQLQVEGHSDSAPVVRHRNEYPTNWELSGSRAFTVVRLLEIHGFPRERLSGVGYSDTRPDGQVARRRIVLKIRGKEAPQEMARR